MHVPPVIKHTAPFIFGVSETISEGFDVTIVTYGMLLEQAVIAHEQLEKAGVSVRLINITRTSSNRRNSRFFGRREKQNSLFH